MKKLLTPLFIFFLTYGVSQSLSLTYNGGILGDTLKVEVPSNQTDMFVWIDITNNSGSTYPLRVRKEIVSLGTPDVQITFCLAGQCLSGDLTAVYNMAIGETLSHTTDEDNAFHLQCADLSGTSELILTFFNAENATDNNTLYVILKREASGITQTSSAVASLTSFPNPATDKVSIEYNFANQTTSPAFVLKNMMGVTVLEEPLYRKTDKIEINVSEIPRGLYFYSISDNGKAILTKKLIVK
jgi:hypothetical protein